MDGNTLIMNTTSHGILGLTRASHQMMITPSPNFVNVSPLPNQSLCQSKEWKKLSDIVNFFIFNNTLLFLDGLSGVSLLRAATRQQCGLSERIMTHHNIIIHWKRWKEEHVLRWLNITRRPILEIFGYEDQVVNWENKINRFFRRFGSQITSLNLRGFTDHIHRFELLNQCPNVVHLSLRNCNIKSENIPELASLDRFKSLQSLDIKGNRIKGTSLCKYVQNLKRLSALNLWHNPVLFIEIQEFLTKIATVESTALFDFLQVVIHGDMARIPINSSLAGRKWKEERLHCWITAKLDCSITDILSNHEVLSYIKRTSVLLTALNISGYQHFDVDGMQILSNCPPLTSLSLPSMSPKTFEKLVKLENLSKLKILRFAQSVLFEQSFQILQMKCPDLEIFQEQGSSLEDDSIEKVKSLISAVQKLPKLTLLEKSLPHKIKTELAVELGFSRPQLFDNITSKFDTHTLNELINECSKNINGVAPEEISTWANNRKTSKINQNRGTLLTELIGPFELETFLCSFGKQIKNLNFKGFLQFGHQDTSTSQFRGVALLQECPNITYLNLSECRINSLMAKKIAELDSLVNLVSIEFQENEIEDAGLRALVPTMKRMAELKFVDLRANGIDKMRAIAKNKIRISELFI